MGVFVTQGTSLGLDCESIFQMPKPTSFLRPSIHGSALKRRSVGNGLQEAPPANREGSFNQDRLTNRETEVLSWVAQGKANWVIGQILNLSPATVRKHLQHIYLKLGVENRTAAALCALELVQSLGRDIAP